MKKAVRTIIKNKAQGIRPCEKVLGSETQVAIVANLWANHADIVQLIATNEILDYLDEEFDSKECAAFKKGIYAMGTFMDKCHAEYLQAQQELTLPPVSKD